MAIDKLLERMNEIDRQQKNEAVFSAMESVQDLLIREVIRLTEWKRSAMVQLAKADRLKAYLPEAKYLGWDVYEAAVTEILSLRARLGASENRAVKPWWKESE